MRTQTAIGPSDTPSVVKYLIIATCAVSISFALIDPIISYYFKTWGLQYLFSLSAQTISNIYIWQIVSYIFVLQPFGNLDFSLIISLLFSMLVLWIFGSQIAQRFGNKSFIKLYFSSGILAALFALPLYLYYPIMTPLAGPTACLYAIFLVWNMMNPHGQILLFFVFPVKAKWLLSGVIGISLLLAISQGAILSLLVLFAGLLSGYLFGTFFKSLQTPFPFMNAVDRFFSRMGEKWENKRNWIVVNKNPKAYHSKAKIFKFKTGEPVETDQEFTDRILEKISKNGKESLSKEEISRLDNISKKSKR